MNNSPSQFDSGDSGRKSWNYYFSARKCATINVSVFLLSPSIDKEAKFGPIDEFFMLEPVVARVVMPAVRLFSGGIDSGRHQL